MTVKQLIDELKQFPENMPVATICDIDWNTKDDPHWIKVQKQMWEHNNYPYDKEDFEYVNLE